MDSKANMMIDGIRKHVHLRSLITDIINNVFESQMGKKAKEKMNLSELDDKRTFQIKNSLAFCYYKL